MYLRQANVVVFTNCRREGDLLFFFFSSRRRHTRLQGDWSSDVCSSDLVTRSPLTRSPVTRSVVRSSYSSSSDITLPLPAPRTRGMGLSAFAKSPVFSPVADRKSTRLNSSHLVISYAVFCLKKNNAIV